MLRTRASEWTNVAEETRQALGALHSCVREEKSVGVIAGQGLGAKGQPDCALQQASEAGRLVCGLEVSAVPWLVLATGQEDGETLLYRLSEYEGIRDASWHVADGRNSLNIPPFGAAASPKGYGMLVRIWEPRIAERRQSS